MTLFEPKIVALLCNWCAYDGADAAGRARLDIPPHVREVRVMCSGQVSPGMVLKAFEAGADGVIVLGCQPGDCHYKEGNLHALKRIVLLRSVLNPTPVDPQRLQLDWVSAGQGHRYAQVVRDMVKRITALGPLPSGHFREER
ncbi:hydrogenase iron-sulfur subunit [uncultured Desulfosarcina sp.]|uniref:hydrogenase iron-sulfur subunit n=1 Tax=uncultured Desulfosarcina sp. TaxID=218289 RepID=UPI0029C9A069|nr:hydrogenase iron-sulfur subunit [uncultured Desulfosarcina sp.]